MAGKGSGRRPNSKSVSDAEMQERWDKAFGRHGENSRVYKSRTTPKGKVFGKPPPKEEDGGNPPNVNLSDELLEDGDTES